jgi:hypothetical protein
VKYKLYEVIWRDRDGRLQRKTLGSPLPKFWKIPNYATEVDFFVTDYEDKIVTTVTRPRRRAKIPASMLKKRGRDRERRPLQS